MATLEQCGAAIEQFAARLAADDDPSRRDLERSFACQITDLHAGFHGRLTGGTIVGLQEGDDPKADVRLSLSGDDLLSLVEGRLHFGKAWASGRVHVHASFRDLLRLRKLL